MNLPAPFVLATDRLHLTARITPWDSDCFGFPVGQIDSLRCLDSIVDRSAMGPFLEWLDQNAIRLMSCRLRHDRPIEWMLLEACGFRFIETVLHPYLDLPDPRYQDRFGFTIEPAELADVSQLEEIAHTAFRHGRIHADPRLGPVLGNGRYRRWVGNSLTHPSQQLIKVKDEEQSIVALFITEVRPDLGSYWHLTAITPRYQGQGYGWRVWKSMLAHHAQDGIRSVRTTITAGNVPVLNLYSKLGFRFLPPEVTFHWCRESTR